MQVKVKSAIVYKKYRQGFRLCSLGIEPAGDKQLKSVMYSQV